MRAARVLVRWGAISLALVVLGLPAPAQAHAQQVGSHPLDDAVLAEPPAGISVSFDEEVTPVAGSIRVFASDGRRVDLGLVGISDDGRVIGTSLRPLDVGTHVVSWRALSADGHLVSGAFLFHVGERTVGLDPDFVAGLLADSGGGPAAASAMARWVTLAAALAAIGLFVFSRFEPGSAAVVAPVMRTMAVVGVVASIAQIPALLLETGGFQIAALTSGQTWSPALTTGLALAAGVRALGFALAALGGRILGWVGWLLLIFAGVATGHSRTVEPAALMWGATVVHVLGAGIWLGGLIAVFLVLRERQRDADPAAAAATLARFSALAAISVVALSLAGAALAWLTVRSPDALGTPYGWVLISKTTLVALVVGIAVYNNRVLLPAVISGEERPATRLARAIRVEVAFLLAVVGITAVLTGTQPAAEAAGVLAPTSVVVGFGDDLLELSVDPGRVGENQIHLYFLTLVGRPAPITGEVTLELAMPARDIGPLIRAPTFAGPGHYRHTGPELTIAGTWQITVRHRVSEFREETIDVEVGIRR